MKNAVFQDVALVDLVRSTVSEERITSILRVEKIREREREVLDVNILN
jgi:hypothetical protein